MIQCSPEAFRALSSREFHLKLRVTWRLTYGDGGIDITDRILSGEMGAISRSLAPFLAGYNASTIGLSIANDDGAFSPYLTTSHLAGGPNNYWGSEIVIEEGVELPDGTFEYLPVTVGRVQEAVFRPGRVEVQAMDILEILKRLPLGEEVRMVGVHPTSAFPIGLNPLLSDFIVDNSWVESGSVATSSRSWSHADKICDGAGWLLSGGFAKGAPLGWAAAEIARSALATLVALEDGTVSIVSEVMPYRWGDDRAAGDIFFPEVFGGDTAAGFQFLETLDTHCTEVIVNYQGAYAAYRATTDEYRVGRIVREVSMPLCARGSQAQWGARLDRKSVV